MIWWHRVGQKVVCTEDFRANGWEALPDTQTPYSNIPEQGKIYTVRAVFVCSAWNDLRFFLQEVVNPVLEYESGRGEAGFETQYFKPVRDTSIESLRELLDPTPKQKRVVFQEIIEEKQRELVR